MNNNEYRLMPVKLLPAIRDALVETGKCFQPEHVWDAIIAKYDLVAAQQPAPIQSAELSASSERGVDYIMAAVQSFAEEWAAIGNGFGERVEAVNTKARIRRMLEDDARALAAALAAPARPDQEQAQSVPEGWREAIAEEKAAQERHYGEVAAAASAGSRMHMGERDCTEGVLLGIQYCVDRLEAIAAAPTPPAPPAAVAAPIDIEDVIASAEAKEAQRAAAMPNEELAIMAMWAGYQRLKELGWNDAMYCPKDGSFFDVIEAGSTGIHSCTYSGQWPTGTYWVHDGDIWPSMSILFRQGAARLNSQSVAYGFEDMHEGNEWTINGPFPSVRSAIDAAMATAASSGEKGVT